MAKTKNGRVVGIYRYLENSNCSIHSRQKKKHALMNKSASTRRYGMYVSYVRVGVYMFGCKMEQRFYDMREKLSSAN